MPLNNYQINYAWVLSPRPTASLGEIPRFMHQVVRDACAELGPTHESQWWVPDALLNEPGVKLCPGT